MMDIENLTDPELVLLTFKDRKNYYHLMKRYEHKLLRYILRISNLTKEDSEDVLQEVFLLVYRNLKSYNSNFKFSSWIYRIAHNQTISYIRKQKSKHKTVDLEDKEIIETISESKEMEDMVLDEIKKEELVKRIGEMDLKYRSVLILRFLEDKEYNEISDILKIPINTVGTLINRAKKILISELKPIVR